ncbi:MAG TPA: hypothetical protein VEV16_07580 [Daejeonella sp.]|nr:hypothetical protein [Daejeonella sp.]
MESLKNQEEILHKEGVAEALMEIAERYDIHDKQILSKEWENIENLLHSFQVKRYIVTPDHLFSQIIIQPFKTDTEIEELKNYLLN